MYTIKDMYDLDHTAAKDYLSQFTYPWEALKGIKDLILEIGAGLDPEEYTEVSEHVWVHKTAKVSEHRASSDRIRKSDTARSSEEARWSVRTALSETAVN